jgi:hypothetical protein
MRDLIDWAEKRQRIPDDPNEPYVAKFEYQVLPEKEFRLFLTTKNLIEFTKHVFILN